MQESDIINVFSSCKFSLVKSYKHNLYVANESGLVKIINLYSIQDEPDFFEICDEITNFEIRNNILAAVNVNGTLGIYELNNNLNSIKRSISVAFRSELPLRDLVFLNDGHVLVGGDLNQVAIVNVDKILKRKIEDEQNDSNDTDLDDDSVIKIQVPDQIRSMQYNNVEQELCISFSSGDLGVYKFHNESISLLSTKQDHFEKFIFSLDYEEFDSLDNLIKVNGSWNSSNNNLAICNKATDILIYKHFKDSDFLRLLTGRHKSSIIEIQYCPFNNKFLASIDFENKLVIWDTSNGKPVKTENLNSKYKLKNISWSFLMENNKIFLSIGTTSGDIFVFDLIVKKETINDAKSENTNVTANNAKRLDFQEEDDDDFNFSDEDTFHQPATSSRKRQREDFELEINDIVDNDDADDSEFFKNSKNILTNYELKPYSIGATPWSNNQRYLTVNEVGYVFCEKNPESSSQTINVEFHNSNKGYYFIDSAGYDLAYLNNEGIILAKSAYIDDKKLSTNFKIEKYQQASIFYRSHKSEIDKWEKSLPIKNYEDESKSCHEFITSINLTKKFIFVFTNYGHVRMLTKFGLLVKIEKNLPCVASVSNGKILFTINAIVEKGRVKSFTYNIIDLLTTTKQSYIEKNQLMPLDYIPRQIASMENNNFDDILDKFENYDLNRNNDLVDKNSTLNDLKSLISIPPLYPLKGLFFNNFGDPCFIDNSNILYILTRWKRASQGTFVPLLNLNEILLTKNLDIIPISLIDNENLNVCFFTRDSVVAHPLPEITEIPIKIPINMNIDVKLLKEYRKEKKQLDDINDFIERDENELEDDLEEESDGYDIDDDDEEISKRLESEHEFLKSKLVSELINESLTLNNHFEKIINSKFQVYKKAKQSAMAHDNDELFLNDLDINLSDNEIVEESGKLRIKSQNFNVNDSIDRLQQLNSVYDKSLLKIFTDYCTNNEFAKAVGLVKELKQDRALIAASRIAERLELAEVTIKINEEREKRLELSDF